MRKWLSPQDEADLLDYFADIEAEASDDPDEQGILVMTITDVVEDIPGSLWAETIGEAQPE